MVGFIDLKGFSTISAGKRAHEIADIVRPFLNSSISILTDNNCLIDKTIGDEIMFVLPQTETGWVAFFDLFKILRKFREFAADHEEYKFRIGISFGELFLDVIDTKNYVEWFVSGEPIIAAKRVMSMPFLSNPNPCIAAICQPVIRKSDLESFCKGIADFEPASWRKKGRTKTVVAKGIGKLSVQIMEPERT